MRYRLVRQHAASFIAHTEAIIGAELPRFIEDEFEAILECGILAHGFLRLRRGDCGYDKLLTFGCKRRGFCPSCGARRMSQAAVQLVDHVIPHVPVRQWVLSLPTPLRVLMAAPPELVTPVMQVVKPVLTCHLLDSAQLDADEGQGGAVTLIQRFGSAANLDIHLHCLVLGQTDRAEPASRAMACWRPTPSCERGWYRTDRPRRHNPPPRLQPPNARSGARSSLSRLVRSASVGRGCSRAFGMRANPEVEAAGTVRARLVRPQQLTRHGVSAVHAP